MNDELKEKPPVWFPVAPIMVVVFIYLILLLSNSIVNRLDWKEFLDIPLIVRLILGVPLILAGLIFFVWGFGQLRPAAAIGFAKRLRKAGAYGLTRNPMYFGVNSAFWGVGFMLDSLPVLLGALMWSILNFLSVTLWEEKQMYGKFGDEYLEYKKQVPRFIPIKFKNRA